MAKILEWSDKDVKEFIFKNAWMSNHGLFLKQKVKTEISAKKEEYTNKGRKLNEKI